MLGIVHMNLINYSKKAHLLVMSSHISRVYLVLSLLALAVLLLGLCLGEVSLSLNTVINSIFNQGSIENEIIWGIRLPRNLCALGVGAMLGISGAIMQGLLRNPLAEPGLLGVSSGAGLGASLAIVFGLGLIPYAVEAMALGFAMLTAIILMGFIRYFYDRQSLILLGVGLTSTLGALMALVFNLSPSPITTSEILNWMMGAVENRSFVDVQVCFFSLAIALAMLRYIGPGLRALTLGEETAHSLGVDIKRLNLLALMCSSLLAGVSVAVAGIIGFVGLAAPHCTRGLGIKDPYDLILPSGIVGAIMVLSADILVRLIPASGELRLGVLTSLIGAPLFVLIAKNISNSWGRDI